MDSSCTRIATWLTQHGDIALASLADEKWITHIAYCRKCRGTLTLLLTNLLHVPYPRDLITCEECLDDLPAFIDIERLESTDAAARAFSHVWWHLLTCSECAEYYRMVAELAREPGQINQRIPSQYANGARLLADVQIKRSTLNRLMQARSHLQVAWGNETNDANDIIVAIKEAEGYDIQLSIRPHLADQWFILVRVAPPVAGSVTLVAKGITIQMTLDANGQTSQEVASDLLTAAQDPDLIVSVIMDAAISSE
jgi:hypothetical protein